MSQRFPVDAAGFLTRRYALALVVVAALTIAAQALVQVVLSRQEHDAAVVNLAGRQRMLSQAMTKAALMAERGDPGRRDELARLHDEWRAAHRRLTDDPDLPGAGRANSVEVRALFAALAPAVSGMDAAIAGLGREPGAVDRLLAAEAAYLPGMEAVVTRYDAEAGARVLRLRQLELVLCLALLVVLAAEAALVFRPAVARLRQAMLDRERLLEQELANRELEVAAAVTRGLGQDLHDGLGQSLTVLALQVKVLGGAVPPAQRPHCEVIGQGLSTAIAEVRAVGRRLVPLDARVVGLVPALEGMAAATRSGGVACTVDWSGEPPPLGYADDLLRIAQEAVANALRHGRATAIAIAGDHGPAGGRLRIGDNGTWKPPEGEGLGLRSMRLRARRLGARLQVGPGAGGGSEVALEWP